MRLPLRDLRRWTGCGLGLVLVAATAWAAGEYVVVSATARGGQEREDESGALRPQSYVISKGQHFGHTKDAQDADAQFELVLKALAPALAEQEYWPAENAKVADLLIVVHWGETEVYHDPLAEMRAESYQAAMDKYREDIARSLGEEGGTVSTAPVPMPHEQRGIADPGWLNELKQADETSSVLAARARKANAELLGYQNSLEREAQRYFASPDEQTMKAELAEGRYFVVLMAWDYAALREQKPSKLQWTTRMSVRSAGNRFVEAVPALVRQGAPLFGRDSDGLLRRRELLDRGKAEVEIGETEVVEDVPSRSP